MKELFADVVEILKGIAAIEWIDEDRGQLDIYQSPPVSFPCALISLDIPTWKETKDPGEQVGTVNLTVSLGFDVRHPIGNAATEILTKALNHLQTVEDVSFALRGLSGSANTYRHLCAMAIRRRITETGIKVYMLSFEGSCRMVPKIEEPAP